MSIYSSSLKRGFIEVAPVQEDERRLPKNHPKVCKVDKNHSLSDPFPGAPPPPFGPVPPLPCAARRWAEAAVWRRCHEKPHGRFFGRKHRGDFDGFHLYKA